VKRAWLALTVLVILGPPREALACACCTNQGQRYVEVETLDGGRLEEIERLRFGPEAQLYVGEAGEQSRASKTRPSATISM
jgi:hypothetical protein